MSFTIKDRYMNLSKHKSPSHVARATLVEANPRTSRISGPQVVGIKILSPVNELTTTLPRPATAGSTRWEMGAREYCNPGTWQSETMATARVNSTRTLTQETSPRNEREMEVPKLAPGLSVPSEI